MDNSYKSGSILNHHTIREIVKEFGIPVFIIDAARIKNNILSLKESLQKAYGISEIYYSYKSNPVPAILKLIHKEGIGAKVISGYELWPALQLGGSSFRDYL